MGLFRRSRTRSDPLLTTAEVAKYIRRDPARVASYAQEGLLPAADATADDESPAWHQSTIRSWWRIQTDRRVAPRRYHQHWSPTPGRQPALLEERVEAIKSPSGTRQVHVRLYQAMDGDGPVAVIGFLDGDPRPPHNWGKVRDRLRAATVVDVEMQPATWLWMHARWREHSNDGRIGFGPSYIHVRDLDDDQADVTPANVRQLIGQTIDVYPSGLYTLAAVRARQSSGDRDTALPTPVLVDWAGIGADLQDLHTLLAAGSLAGADDHFVAGLLAARLIEASTDIIDWGGARLAKGGGPPCPAIGHQFTTAVIPAERRLTAVERALCNDHQLAPPLIARQEPLSAEERELLGVPGLQRLFLRDDARNTLDRLRHVLADPDLPDESPRRKALARGEALLVETCYRADAAFRRADRTPEPIVWSSASPEMIEYLAQLRATTVSDLRYELRRRGRSLFRRQDVATWEATQLLVDDEAGLLAVTGTKPSLPRQNAIQEHLPTLRPGERPSTAKLDTQADPKVLLEWPHAGRRYGSKLLDGRRLVAPAASYGVSRPVFLRNRDGRLSPLTLDGAGRGFVWGVSSTDTITSTIHALLINPQPSWASSGPDDPEVEQHAKNFLANHVAISSGRLDVDGTTIVAQYRRLGLL